MHVLKKRCHKCSESRMMLSIFFPHSQEMPVIFKMHRMFLFAPIFKKNLHLNALNKLRVSNTFSQAVYCKFK